MPRKKPSDDDNHTINPPDNSETKEEKQQSRHTPRNAKRKPQKPSDHVDYTNEPLDNSEGDEETYLETVLEQDENDAKYEQRDTTWGGEQVGVDGAGYANDDGDQGGGGGGGAGGAMASGRVVLSRPRKTVASFDCRDLSELPSAELALAQAELLNTHLKSYYVDIFFTLDNLVLDLDRLKDKQFGTLERVMLVYTALKQDPMDHLDEQTHLLQALREEQPWTEDAQEIFEKEEAVISLVNSARLSVQTFLRKFEKLKVQAIALREQGTECTNILDTLGVIVAIGTQWADLNEKYPRVQNVLSWLYLQDRYRSSRQGGFACMYESYVKLETAALRKEKDTQDRDKRAAGRKNNQLNLPSMSQLELNLRNSTETHGTLPDSVAGASEVDTPYQLSHTGAELRSVWNAAFATVHHFEFHTIEATMAWAREHPEYIKKYLRFIGVDEDERHKLTMDPLSLILNSWRYEHDIEVAWMDIEEDDGAADADSGAAAVDDGTAAMDNGAAAVDDGTAAMDNGAVAVDDAAPAAEIAAKAAEAQLIKWKAQREQTKTRTLTDQQERRDAAAIMRSTACEHRDSQHSDTQSAMPRVGRGHPVARAAIPLTYHAGAGSSSTSGRAGATPAPAAAPPPAVAAARAPGPTQHTATLPPVQHTATLPPVHEPRAPNYTPIPFNIDQSLSWPSSRRVANPNMIVAADYYEKCIRVLKGYRNELVLRNYFERTEETAQKIRDNEKQLVQAAEMQKHNAKKLSGEVRHSPVWVELTRQLRASDEIQRQKNASMVAQRAAAAAAQQAQVHQREMAMRQVSDASPASG